MHIESRKRHSYARKRKSGYKIKFLLLILILIFIFLFAYRENSPKFDFDKYFEASYKEEVDMARVAAYANNIAVVDADNISIGDYSPEVGLLVSRIGGNAIFSKDAFRHMNPASTTKLMTILVAMKYGNLSDEVEIGNEVVINEAGATMANIKPGDKLSLEQLLYGLMLPSGNDAANAIAVHISGSEEAFANLMNEEAKKIYAVDSNFKNAHGLSAEGHYTSAYDLYLIINECLKYDIFRKITTTRAYEPTYRLSNGELFINHWDNSNLYLSTRTLPDNLELIGAKTGTTRAAGSCLVMATKNKQSEEEYVSIVLKATNKEILYQSMDKLLYKLSE